MHWLYALMGKLFGWDKQMEEYWRRFIAPQIERARELGFDDDQIGRMLQYAQDGADFVTRFPAALLRDLIDDLAPVIAKRSNE